MSPEKLDAQTVDNQHWKPFQFLGSLHPVGRGWGANKSLLRSWTRKQLIINIGSLFSFLDHCTPSDGVGGLTNRCRQKPLPLPVATGL